MRSEARRRCFTIAAVLGVDSFASIPKYRALGDTIDAWLRDEVVPAAKALRADPTRALTPEQLRAHLAKKRSGAA